MPCLPSTLRKDDTDETLISIQAENKTGLYFTQDENGKVTLSQDTDASEETAAAQTFQTVTALNGNGDLISFRSYSDPEKYLTVVNGILMLTDGSDADGSSFSVE